MEKEQLDEDDHDAQPDGPLLPRKPRVRYEMCASEHHLAWEWVQSAREASP